MDSGTILLSSTSHPDSINIFTTEESILDFYVYEATFIFLVIFFVILIRIIKFN